MIPLLECIVFAYVVLLTVKMLFGRKE